MTLRPSRIALAALLLPALLAGCDALYEDTKGWANRLEASVLKLGEETGEPGPEAAPQAAPAAMPAPPAVPVEPVAVVSLPASAAPQPAPAPQASEPQAPGGVLAAASATLLEPAPADAKTETQQDAAAAPPPKPKTKPAGPAVAAAGDAARAAVLHLSSLRSEEAAKRQWSDLQHSFPEPLGGLQAQISRTELGEKGTFYRVLAGPLPSSDAASQVCAALKAKDSRQYCRVVPAEPKS